MNKKLPISENLTRATVILFTATAFSYFTGIIFQIILAYYFGISPEMDAYQFAFSLYDVITAMTGVTIQVIVIPIYIKLIHGKNDTSIEDFTSTIFTVIFILITGISITGFILSPIIIEKFTGLLGRNVKLARDLLSAFSLLIIPSTLLTLMVSILNARKHFSTPAIINALFGILPICLILIGVNFLGIYSLLFGTALSFITSFFLIYFFFKKLHIIKFRLKLNHPSIKTTILLSIPAFFSIAGAQINTMVDRLMASTLQTGSISSLFYAKSIREIPLALFIAPLVLSVFPSFSEAAVNNDRSEIVRLFSLSIRLTIFMLLPAMVWLLILGKSFIELFLQHGVFSINASFNTYNVLIFYLAGLVFYGFIIFQAKLFYALQRIKIVIYIGLLSIISNIILNYILMKMFGVVGLALSTSVIEISFSAVMFYIIKKILKQIDGRRITETFLKVMVASAVMGAFVYTSLLGVKYFWSGDSIYCRLLALIVPGIFGIVIYLVMSLILKINEFRFIVEQASTMMPFRLFGFGRLESLWGKNQ